MQGVESREHRSFPSSLLVAVYGHLRHLDSNAVMVALGVDEDEVELYSTYSQRCGGA